MAQRAKWIKQLNQIDSCNVDICEFLTSTSRLEDIFPNESYLLSVFNNYRSCQLNELTLFWCSCITLMHWSSDTKLFDKEKLDYTTIKLFGILRGNSVSNKSGYIKLIRQASDFVESYFREMFTDANNKFNSTCVESVTNARLLTELECSSKFLSSDEDRPLNDIGFYEPNSPKAKESHPCLMSAFNGIYKLQRSTMTYLNDIKERSLTILVPTTGDRWWSLLDHFNDAYQTNGLYERFLYWVIGKKNFVHDRPPLNDKLPSLEYIFITRVLIGQRIYEYDDDALNYLRPVLSDMRANRVSAEGLFSCSQNKRSEACQRRGADLIERLCVVFQNIFDTLKVLQPIESIQFDRIQKNTLNEIKTNIQNIFYSNDISDGTDDPTYSDNVDLKDLVEVQITSVKKRPVKSMKIGLTAAKAAVKFFKKLLLPQSIQLFSTDTIDLKKGLVNELKVIQHPMNCFSLSDLTHNSVFHNYKRDNIDVKEILSSLERKHILKHGKFLKVGSRPIDSWIKVIPDPNNDDEIRFLRNELTICYQLDLQKYIDIYANGIDFKPSLIAAAQDTLLIQRKWIDQLRQKLDSLTIQPDFFECIFDSDECERETPQVEDVLQDIIDSLVHNPIDLQASCLTPNDLNELNKEINVPLDVEVCHENNDIVVHNKQVDESSVLDCLSDLTAQVVDIIKKVDNMTAHTNSDKNIESARTMYESNCISISESMKALCKRILLIDSVILSSTKLSKTCKTNMVDVRKACTVLIERGFLSIQNKMLANKSTYHECYLKHIPQNQSSLIDFSLNLATFGITNIDSYYQTLKKIDTKNGTYLTSHGVSILKQKPYSDLEISIKESNVIEPTKEGCRKFFDLLANDEIVPKKKRNLTVAKTTVQALDNASPNTKRRRELTDKAKEYQEQLMQTKKKK